MGMLFRSKPTSTLTTLVIMVVITLPLLAFSFQAPTAYAATVKTSTSHTNISCASGRPLCTEVWDSEAVFGEGVYVGHDEPSTLFYSNVPGSGNRMRYELTLPQDPSPSDPMTPGKSYNFELHPAFWFGMAMCDTQSFPEQLSTCTPDSDSNIVDPAISPKHPGEAFMELQFYPPGYVQQFTGFSCDAIKWCAALTIDSLSENPVTGQTLNSTCASLVGLEYVNFAYITKNGIPQAVPNPVQFNPADQTPDLKKVLFMNQGDHIVITLHDTEHGLRTELQDLTTGQSGFMTASAANGFGQVQYAPTGTTCKNISYDFHPMYSTSSEKTRVTWAAHSYNIAFADEIGHFDFCSAVDTSTGTCKGKEGIPGDQEPADVDDAGCFPASASTLVEVSGCTAANTGFDGTSYQQLWPDGNTQLHPTPIRFSSPTTGDDYNVQYNRFAFEADLPRIEASDSNGPCDRNTGVRCTLIPQTDDGLPAVFYPFFSITNHNGDCVWQLGNHIPGSLNDFHQNQQYGTLLNVTYTGPGGMPITRYNDFRQIFANNPCPE
jgi:hypothetical protein